MVRYILGVIAGGMVASSAAGQATVKAEIVETDPGADATLGRGETFWVRIHYESAEPVKLWARPYFRGEEAPAASNPSVDHVGSGYALGWFSFREPAEVDEIRVSAGGGKPYREWMVASYPAKLHWTSATAGRRESAAWVAQLRAADEAVRRATADSAMNEPVTAGDIALMRGLGLVVLAAVLGGIAAPIRAYRRWNGGWRMAAAAPLLLLCFAVVRIVIDTSIDPTSHNLWPMELGMFSLGALVITGVLALGRRVTGANRG
jgi:hypothetical protein